MLDLFKRIRLRATPGMWIWLILNYVLVTAFTAGIGLLAYPILLLIAVSSTGEALLRWITGCKKITRVDIHERIDPLFQETYRKAKLVDPNIPDDVILYICEDNIPNSYALGRKTICITTTLLEMPDEVIKGCIGHEFGHISHHDTDLVLIVTCGNIFAILFGIISRFLIALIGKTDTSMHFPGMMSILDTDNSAPMIEFIFSIILSILIWGWTKIGSLLVLKSNRNMEFEADEFAFNIGYGNFLCVFIDAMKDINVNGNGLFAMLEKNHPSGNDRISYLQKLGATYRCDGTEE